MLIQTLSILVFAAFSAISVQAQTKVSGQILPGKSYPLELWAYDLTSNNYKFEKKLDLTDAGEFQFEVPNEPGLYRLYMSGEGMVFVNDGDETIEINIDLKNGDSPFKIEGSAASSHLLDYMATVAQLQEKYLYPLEPLMKDALKSKDQTRIDEVAAQHEENLKIFVGTLDKKIAAMGSSLAVYAIITTLDFNKYLTNIEAYEKTFIAERPDLPYTKKLHQLIADAKRIQVGMQAPNFELARLNEEGKQKLSDLRGNFVLIDFWASWCLPCRKENPEFKNVYAAYKEKGLNVWGISLDKKESAWEKAIKKDDLPWLHSRLVDDEVENLYKVVSLPTNFLIDRDGKIVARNINAEELANLLEELIE